MTLGHDILSKLKIDLCLSNKNNMGNRDTHKGCMAPMKYASEININLSCDRLKNNNFCNKGLCESEHVLNAMGRTCHIFFLFILVRLP